MPDLSIGLTGLNAALKAIEVVGNNIANASTEGYHRQEVRITALESESGTGLRVGGGAQVSEVRRLIDRVVESELLRQQPSAGQVSQELDTLQAIESVLGDLSTGGLSTAINKFFSALKQLAGQPDSPVLRDQVVWAADTVVNQFHSIAGAVASLGRDLDVEGRNLVDRANALAAEIGGLNAQISELHYRGTPDNNLLDMRDQAVSQLCELLDVQVQPQDDGSVNLLTGGTALVIRSKVTPLELGYTDQAQLGLGVAGANHFDTQVQGGRLGGLLALKNQLIPDILGRLDTLAGQIIRNINRLHAQGIGLDGSFQHLDGWIAADDLGAWDPPLAAGQIFIRITDTATGAVRRETITVNPSSANPAESTLAGVAAQFDALDGITATVAGSRLHLIADAGCTFDFLPAPLPQPDSSTLSGTAGPTVSGLYSGAANQTFTFRVVGTGNVGVTPNLALEVTDGTGTVVATLTVGLGYAAGDVREAADGLGVAIAAGDLNDGETFTVRAIASSDTSGLLAGAGLNAFFRGSSAQSIDLVADLRVSSGRLAAAAGGDGTDNVNIRRMAAVGDVAMPALGGVTLGDYHRRLIADVGQQISVRQARRQALEYTTRQLANQRDRFSGVDLNEEAANLMIFEQLFQSMAKYLSIAQQTQQALLDML